MSRVLPPSPAEAPIDPGLVHSQSPEGARSQGPRQSPRRVLAADHSPDLVPGQGAEEHPQNHQKNPLS